MNCDRELGISYLAIPCKRNVSGDVLVTPLPRLVGDGSSGRGDITAPGAVGTNEALVV